MTEPSPVAAFEPINLEQVQDLIRKKHGLILDKSDPILLSVSLHQAFCEDYGQMLCKHHGALTAHGEDLMAQSTAAVEESLGVLRDTALKSSLATTLAEVTEKARQSAEVITEIKETNRSHRRWMAVFTLIVVLGTALNLYPVLQ